MADIRVGVMRIRNGIEVTDTDEHGFEIFQKWVEINGVRFTDPSLMGVTYGLARSMPERDNDGALIYNDWNQVVTQDRLEGEVLISFASEGFATVDHREPLGSANPPGVKPDDAQVICPNCAHQFPAVPVNVQTAIRRALDELGVPSEDYPAPVANAVAILKEAIP